MAAQASSTSYTVTKHAKQTFELVAFKRCKVPLAAPAHSARRVCQSGRAAARALASFSAEQQQQQQQGFHQSRLKATDSPTSLPPLKVEIRVAEQDDELRAVAALRAVSFYAYPPEREFAGKRHQLMIEEEEFTSLKQQRMRQRLADQQVANVAAATSSNASGGSAPLPQERAPAERSVPLMAVCVADDMEGGACDERFKLQGKNSGMAVAGTLDLYAIKAMPGEVLIGTAANPAYLANVCVAPGARRRDVGGQLLQAARERARVWGVDAMYVHIMAVNEQARRFYERSGFTVEKEESSNQAHYRGRCLDGVEGAGRTLLLRDTLL